MKRFVFTLSIVFSLLAAGSIWAQEATSTVILTPTEGEAQTMEGLSQGQLVRALSKFLTGKEDGVFELHGEGLTTRFEKKGEKMLITRSSTTKEVYETFVASYARGIQISCKSNLKNLGTASEMYSTDFSGAYPEKMSQLTPEYLRQIPICPSDGASPYTYRRAKIDGYDSYEFVCGGDHSEAGTPKGYPRYNGQTGIVVKPE